MNLFQLSTIPKILDRAGIVILSTSLGMITYQEIQLQTIRGEILCYTLWFFSDILIWPLNFHLLNSFGFYLFFIDLDCMKPFLLLI